MSALDTLLKDVETEKTKERCQFRERKISDLQDHLQKLKLEGNFLRKQHKALENARSRFGVQKVYCRPKPLSPAEKSRVRDAWACSRSTTLVANFNIDITAEDLKRLRGSNWLCDEIVNYYFNLLVQAYGGPDIAILSSFFFTKLKTSGYSGVRRWSKKFDFTKLSKLLFPINVGNMHWCLGSFNFDLQKVEIFDSLNSNHSQMFQILQDYLKEENLSRKFGLDVGQWCCDTSLTASGLQQDGHSCGVFTCMFARYAMAGAAFDFDQTDMEEFRYTMAFEILSGEIASEM